MLNSKKRKSKKPADPWQERIPDTPENVALALLTTTPEVYKEQTEKQNALKNGNEPVE